MAYGSPHSSTLPTVSVTTGPTYATQINAAIQEIRDTVDAAVTPAGIDIDDDLSFLSGGTNYSAIDLKKVAFEDQGIALPAASNPNAVYVRGGELYYNDDASQQVQITNGGALNISATGGITGTGYGSSGVEVNWNAGSTQYRFKSGSGNNDYAHIVANDLLLNDGSDNFIRFASPALAADYTVTWPNAVPASTLPLLMSNAGTLSASGTLANLVSFTTSGAGTVGGLLTASASVDVTGTVTASSIVTGSELLFTGVRTRIIPANQFSTTNPAGSTYWVLNSAGWYIAPEDTAATDYIAVIPLPVDLGDRFLGAITVRHQRDTTDDLTATFYSETGETLSAAIATATSSNANNNWADLALSFSAFDVAASTQYFIKLEATTNGGNDTDLKVSRIAFTWRHSG